MGRGGGAAFYEFFSQNSVFFLIDGFPNLFLFLSESGVGISTKHRVGNQCKMQGVMNYIHILGTLKEVLALTLFPPPGWHQERWEFCQTEGQCFPSNRI